MPQTDQLQPPSPSPFRLGFRPPSPDALQSSPPLPSPGTSPENLEDLSLDEPAPASDGWDLDESPESLDDTSSPGSTPAPEPAKVDLLTEDEAIDLARSGVAAAGQKAHDLLATSEGQKAVGLYLTDEADQANIGTPLGKIAARHQGIGGQVNPDTKDLLSALVGLAGYATKQINRRTVARQLDAGAGGLAGNPQPIPEDL